MGSFEKEGFSIQYILKYSNMNKLVPVTPVLVKEGGRRIEVSSNPAWDRVRFSLKAKESRSS